MHEYAIKLDMKSGLTQTHQQDLESEEELYTKSLRDLSAMQELKQLKLDDLKL